MISIFIFFILRNSKSHITNNYKNFINSFAFTLITLIIQGIILYKVLNHLFHIQLIVLLLIKPSLHFLFTFKLLTK